MKNDYYEILGVEKTADEASIKRAYRTLAMKCHPDRNGGDCQAVEKMKELNEAYAVLSDSRKRQLYDSYGHAGLEGYSMDDIMGGIDFSSILREFGIGGFDLGGVFDGFFGGRRTATRERVRGADLRYDLKLTLEEAAAGVERKIEVPSSKRCQSCHGTGAGEGGLKSCDRCRGSGQMVREQSSGHSVFRQISVCSQCRGQGKVIEKPCPDCEGKGFLSETRDVVISVPKGVDTGHSIRIGGAGEAGPEGSPPGDLYVILEIKKHPIFERHGDDIAMSQKVSFAQAALGGMIEDLPGLEGKLKLEIPEGIQTGAILKIKSKGMPRLEGYGRGDQYVVVQVVTPTKLSKKEKELLIEFERIRQGKDK